MHCLLAVVLIDQPQTFIFPLRIDGSTFQSDLSLLLLFTARPVQNQGGRLVNFPESSQFCHNSLEKRTKAISFITFVSTTKLVLFKFPKKSIFIPLSLSRRAVGINQRLARRTSINPSFYRDFSPVILSDSAIVICGLNILVFGVSTGTYRTQARNGRVI